MSATPRSARLSSPTEVVAILVASAVVWVAVIAGVSILFFAVFIPAVEFSGKGDIPSDFPVYPGAHLESAFSSSVGACSTVQATWSTTASGDSVFAFYQQNLAGGDWTISSATNGRIDFASASGPERSGTIYIRTNQYAGQTVIDLVLTGVRSGSNARCVSGTVG